MEENLFTEQTVMNMHNSICIRLCHIRTVKGVFYAKQKNDCNCSISGYELQHPFCSRGKEGRKKARQRCIGSPGICPYPALGVSAGGVGYGFPLTQFDLGFHAAMLGLPTPTKAWHSKLTPMVNIDLGIGGKLKLRSNPNGKTDSAVLFQMSVLCGYTFKPITNLYLTPAAGIGFSAGSVKTTTTVTTPDVSGTSTQTQNSEVKNVYKLGGFSFAWYFGIKYFFTDLIGIEATLIDTLTLSFNPVGSGSGNTLVFKVGPTFRLGMKV